MEFVAVARTASCAPIRLRARPPLPDREDERPKWRGANYLLTYRSGVSEHGGCPGEWPRVVGYNQSISLTRRRAAFLAGRPPIRARSRLEFRALPTAIAVCYIDVALPRCACLRSGSSPSKLVKLGGGVVAMFCCGDVAG
jgi:hypothetical protein